MTKRFKCYVSMLKPGYKFWSSASCRYLTVLNAYQDCSVFAVEVCGRDMPMYFRSDKDIVEIPRAIAKKVYGEKNLNR